MLADLALSLERDCRWHRAWSDALLGSALAECPDNLSSVRQWIEHWWAPTRAALPALVEPWCVDAERARELVSSVETKLRVRWSALGIAA